MPVPEVRPAEPADAVSIATVQLEVWQTTFADLLPAELVAMPADELADSWAPLLPSVLVGVEGAHLTGFAHLGSVDDAGLGEIALLYVRPAWGRRGHGGRLLAAAGAALAARRAQLGSWWIPVNDLASQRFARSVGWERTAEARAFDTGRALLRERRWTGSLDFRLD
jgi:GNAT superfamily N-acetyltransferase